MRKVSLVLLATSIAIGLAILAKSAPQSKASRGHSEWVAKSLEEMETIKIGMTRAELLKVFTVEGGLSTREWRQYVYRECPYIKVAVEFEPVGELEAPGVWESPRDKIVKISRPFIELSVID